MTVLGPMESAFAKALREASVPPSDGAAVALAVRYCELLDAARGGVDEEKLFADLGPRLLAVLTSLGMTLAGRPAKGVVTGAAEESPLKRQRDELAARRAQRSG